MRTSIKITTSTKDILDKYDTDKLLTQALPQNYKDKILPEVLRVYSSRVKLSHCITISLPNDIYYSLKAIADNYSVPFTLLFNFLIETIADCSKINTKKVQQALDCYYYAVANNKALFSTILSAYADSVYYKKETGLNEKDVACFLTLSEERTSHFKRI